jgi:hypothetical protein
VTLNLKINFFGLSADLLARSFALFSTLHDRLEGTGYSIEREKTPLQIKVQTVEERKKSTSIAAQQTPNWFDLHNLLVGPEIPILTQCIDILFLFDFENNLF